MISNSQWLIEGLQIKPNIAKKYYYMIWGGGAIFSETRSCTNVDDGIDGAPMAGSLF